ncbi:MAG TPA: hypothetical protein VIJ50_04975 [Solirubrobacteraceae bacterium]
MQSGGNVAVKLTCTGTGGASCRGTLTLLSGNPRKGKKAKTFGRSTFSIPAGGTSVVKLELDGTGRVSLEANHGRLGGTLTIVKSSPAPSQVLIDNVEVMQRKVAKPKTPTR